MVQLKKRFLGIILSLLTMMLTAGSPLYAQNTRLSGEMTIETSSLSSGKWTLPYVTAHSAVLLDAETGELLYDRDGNVQRPPASTTKIMTAILALELTEPEEITTVSEKAGGVGESSIYLDKGDKIKIGELLEGALLSSGNDACVALAEKTAGSQDEFIRLMNQKAASLGAYRTNFVNPNGLPDPNHYSTAFDLALITRYAMNAPQFAEIVSQKYSVINFEEPRKSQNAKNTNKLLWNYPLADGVKTGTTNAAGKCLVASASKDGRRLICVVLNAPDRFGDAQRLLQWGFDYTGIIEIGKKGDVAGNFPISDTEIPLVLSEDIRLCLEKDMIKGLKMQINLRTEIDYPIKEGDILGHYQIYAENKLLKEVPLLAQHDGENPGNLPGKVRIFVDDLLDFFSKKG
ncbi:MULTISPECIES: D-alanyl-D-alanine carboxypeptidase family protein [Dehalobacter]|uniref:D-alanyl-D-alanine carboxypeptidase family protein n=1 Tax=Dehalobacter TaxID=56112 RepID=UPI001FA6ED03|nr:MULTISPECIES: D-alanyl-D-alanine carboxypeptidase family protein [Dehalobacter]MDJ0304328.1 D-alanyl-D-alanine carboxypeptidase [Dehalobacter sp.]